VRDVNKTVEYFALDMCPGESASSVLGREPSAVDEFFDLCGDHPLTRLEPCLVVSLL
jgi:hypothetical protein